MLTAVCVPYVRGVEGAGLFQMCKRGLQHPSNSLEVNHRHDQVFLLMLENITGGNSHTQ